MSDPILEQNWFVLVRAHEPKQPRHSLETAARLTRVHPDMLGHYCHLGLLGAARIKADAETTFDDDALYEVRRIQHLRRHHGVNLSALLFVCNLTRKVEQLQTELRFLKEY